MTSALVVVSWFSVVDGVVALVTAAVVVVVIFDSDTETVDDVDCVVRGKALVELFKLIGASVILRLIGVIIVDPFSAFVTFTMVPFSRTTVELSSDDVIPFSVMLTVTFNGMTLTVLKGISAA